MPMPGFMTQADLRPLAFTPHVEDFAHMRFYFPDRLNIVSEGDSWFAYPPAGIFAGKPSNLISYLSKWTKGKANFLTLASSGDEAVDMISGKQKHKLIDIIRWHKEPGTTGRKPLDLILFSGGGNDLVGRNDFERFLKKSNTGTTAQSYVNLGRLKRKGKQIKLAYDELVDIRNQYSPTTRIISHTYDYPYPSDTGGEFLGGLIRTKAWMKRFMDDPAVAVPDALQVEVIKLFFDTIGDSLTALGNKRNGLEIVETRGTLKGEKAWLNEIHPNSKGFKAIAAKIFKEMQNQFSVLK